MKWYDEAVFYHIYPLGLTGAPMQNDYGEPVHRLNSLIPWISHIREIGCNALYIGPLFQSVGHGYETTDYRTVDSRLGTNEDLTEFVRVCHENGIRVILDGVFNHTGRDFFAFKDIQEYRENSWKLGWYCNVNFGGNNEFNDGFSYDNWGGYNLLAKLNQRNPEVQGYLLDTIRFWVSEFDIDGLRLDAADVLDFDFMRSLRELADTVKEDFWLMGEVIHGDYTRWANDNTLHSVTNYHLHKALYSAHNDHNYFEIAHTVGRQISDGLGGLRLYNFVDNHDVERIYTRLRNKAHFTPTHILLYTLPGIPSIYYGSEWGIEGKKERTSDASLRPELHLEEMHDNACSELITALGRIHQEEKALSYGDYRELQLTTTQYAFSRGDVIVCVNNSDNEVEFNVEGNGKYRGALTGWEAESHNGRLVVRIPGCSGEIWIPEDRQYNFEPLTETVGQNDNSAPQVDATRAAEAAGATEAPMAEGAESCAQNAAENKDPQRSADPNKPYEEMTIEELQAEILAKMAANGPVTDRMRQDVIENVYHDSLLTWVRSFR